MPVQAIYHPSGADRVYQVIMPVPTAINGWSIAFTVKALPGDVSPLLSKTTAGGGIVVIDAVNGVFNVVLSAADTATIAPGDYVYDVWRTDAGLSGPIVPTSPFVLTKQP